MRHHRKKKKKKKKKRERERERERVSAIPQFFFLFIESFLTSDSRLILQLRNPAETLRCTRAKEHSSFRCTQFPQKETVVCRFRPCSQTNGRLRLVSKRQAVCLWGIVPTHPTTSTCRPANCCFAACATLYHWAAGNDVSFGRCCLDLEGKRLFDRRYKNKEIILGDAVIVC